LSNKQQFFVYNLRFFPLVETQDNAPTDSSVYSESVRDQLELLFGF